VTRGSIRAGQEAACALPVSLGSSMQAQAKSAHRPAPTAWRERLPRTKAHQLVRRATQGPSSRPRDSQPVVLAQRATARQALARSPAWLARRACSSPIPGALSAILARQANSRQDRQAQFVAYAPRESFLLALERPSAQTASLVGIRLPPEGLSAQHVSRAGRNP
jgi:hypothetical protein